MISEERREQLNKAVKQGLEHGSINEAMLALGVSELLAEIWRLERVPATSAWRQQLTDVQLASVQGVWEALDGDEHLGDVGRRLGITPRTLRGDAFEHAFEWARRRAEPGPKRLHSPIFCGTCEEDPDGSAKHCAGCGRVF